MRRKLQSLCASISLLGVITIQQTSADAAPSGQQQFAYVAESPGEVAVISLANNTIVTQVQVGPTNAGTVDVSASPNGSDVYASNTSTNTVSVIATSTNTMVGSINITSPGSIAVSPNSETVYVADSTGVAVIDASSDAVVANISTSPSAAIALNRSGERLYTTGSYPEVGDETIPISTATDKPGPPILGAGGLAIAVDPAGGGVYALSGSTADTQGHVEVISQKTNTVVQKIPVQGEKLAVDPSGQYVYVIQPNINRSAIAVIKASSRTVIGKITGIGYVALYMAVNSAGTVGYVTYLTGRLAVVNLTTGKVQKRLALVGIAEQVAIV